MSVVGGLLRCNTRQTYRWAKTFAFLLWSVCICFYFFSVTIVIFTKQVNEIEKKNVLKCDLFAPTSIVEVNST